MLVKMSTKGQIVVPADLRVKYGLAPGDRVDIRDGDGKIFIFPVAQDPIQQARGMLRGPTCLTDALLSERTEERRREEAKLTHQ